MARKNEPYIYKVLRRETPSPRQQEFFRAEAANVAYGGARGGGKSWAMRRKLVMLAMRYPGLKLLLLRLPRLPQRWKPPMKRKRNSVFRLFVGRTVRMGDDSLPLWSIRCLHLCLSN